MKARSWALIFSLVMATTAKAQQPATPPATNTLATNGLGKVAEIRAKAENGDAAAQAELGQMYEWGKGVPQDSAEAVKWSRKAAEQGNADGQFNLVFMYACGMGVDENCAEAIKWYRKAAEQGNAFAQEILGEHLYHGNGVARDYAEAVKWYRKAAERGDAAAQQNRKDASLSFWSVAQFNLGLCYERGQGVPQDYAEAVHWYKKSAELSNADAQSSLGFCYYLGYGVPQDYVEAYKWYNLAAAQNDTNAIHSRDQLTESMTPSQIAEGQRLSREFLARKEGAASNKDDGQNSVVPGNQPRFTGTGFFVTDDGYLLTSYHVVEDAAGIAIRTKAGTFVATILKADKANDIALLKVTGRFPAMPVTSSREVKLGETVFTIGFPNVQLQGFAPKLTKGEISSLTGIQDDPRYFQISSPVQPGNSGGALVDNRGNVVGVVSAKLDAATALAASGALPENVNYAIKSSFLLSFLESVPEVAAKMKEPGTKEQQFEDVVKSAEQAAVLVLVY